MAPEVFQVGRLSQLSERLDLLRRIAVWSLCTELKLLLWLGYHPRYFTLAGFASRTRELGGSAGGSREGARIGGEGGSQPGGDKREREREKMH